nr:MAG TPA: hypothetical protein [Caudoviricetes sp.]
MVHNENRKELIMDTPSNAVTTRDILLTGSAIYIVAWWVTIKYWFDQPESYQS